MGQASDFQVWKGSANNPLESLFETYFEQRGVLNNRILMPTLFAYRSQKGSVTTSTRLEDAEKRNLG